MESKWGQMESNGVSNVPKAVFASVLRTWVGTVGAGARGGARSARGGGHRFLIAQTEVGVKKGPKGAGPTKWGQNGGHKGPQMGVNMGPKWGSKRAQNVWGSKWAQKWGSKWGQFGGHTYVRNGPKMESKWGSNGVKGETNGG